MWVAFPRKNIFARLFMRLFRYPGTRSPALRRSK